MWGVVRWTARALWMKRDGTDDDNMTVESDEEAADVEKVAFLIDQLKHEDTAVRTSSYANLVKIARVLGPQRVRDELIPFLSDSTEDTDEVLTVSHHGPPSTTTQFEREWSVPRPVPCVRSGPSSVARR